MRRRCTAARSATGALKVSVIGVPIPTVCPLTGPHETLREFAGFTVVKIAPATVVPDIPGAAEVCAVTWYRVSANSPSLDVQVMASAESCPRRTPAAVSWDLLAFRIAVTDCSGALLCTTTVPVTGTPSAPSAGVMTTSGAAAVGVAGAGAPVTGLSAARGEHDRTAVPTSTVAMTLDSNGPRDPNMRGTGCAHIIDRHLLSDVPSFTAGPYPAIPTNDLSIIKIASVNRTTTTIRRTLEYRE